MDVTYNPETISFSFFNKTRPKGMGIKKEDYPAGPGYNTFNLNLILDELNPTQNVRIANPITYGKLVFKRLLGGTIKKQVQQYVDFCQGTPGSPNFLEINWAPCGKQGIIHCRLTDLNVDYVMFDFRGNPLRAKLKLTFLIDNYDPTIPWRFSLF